MTTHISNRVLVHLYVYDRFADWEVGLLTAHLNSFEGQFLPSRFRVLTVGTTRNPVVSMGGLSVVPDATLGDVDADQCALLILPGGLGWEHGRHADALDVARSLLQRGVPIAAICGATYGLALAGVLDSRQHTSNARQYLAASGYSGGELYQEAPAVADRGVITASSTAAVEFATEAFRCLGLYPPEVLEAWSCLFTTGETRHFGTLAQHSVSHSAQA